jgi:hypothetical protein
LLHSYHVQEFDFGFIVLFGFEELLAACEVTFEFCGAGAARGEDKRAESQEESD